MRVKWEDLYQVPRMLSDREGALIKVSYRCYPPPPHTSERCWMEDRGREGVSSLLQNLGRGRVRQCGWEGGDKRKQMTEPEPGSEKHGTAGGKGDHPWSSPCSVAGCLGVQGKAGPGWWVGWKLGFLDLLSTWLLGPPPRPILTPLLSRLIWLNLWEILLPPLPNV